MIQYIDVHKSFERPVLEGVTLTVGSGELLAIVGPSGGGKSVLLKTTNGLIVPDRGDVRIDGESIYFGPPGILERWRRAIGYVFQYAALFDSMNVFDNVALGIPEDEAKKMPLREKLSRVARALRAVRLVPNVVLAKLPSELSGGMRKRVGIARAIIGRPNILLYDEPVTGLDPVTSAAIDRLIGGLRRQLSATGVVVTHDVEGALELCDRVALLDGGRIRFVGTPDGFRASEDPLVRAFADRRMAAAMGEKEAAT
jgi:phospholipid/cholesterol/gamma-HCH transport system ATP-binding protein